MPAMSESSLLFQTRQSEKYEPLRTIARAPLPIGRQACDRALPDSKSCRWGGTSGRDDGTGWRQYARNSRQCLGSDRAMRVMWRELLANEKLSFVAILLFVVMGIAHSPLWIALVAASEERAPQRARRALRGASR